MKKLSFLLFQFLLFYTAFAQTGNVSSGSVAIGSGGSASYSIGQVTNYTYTSSGGSFIIQGVQQPTEISVLPITLLYFKAEGFENKQVNLTWSTVNEYNNSFFTVERSKTLRDFNEINKVLSLGDNTNTQDYHSIDFKPLTGISYYRLKQTDKDGRFTYSKIIAVEIKINTISVFPNPATEFLALETKDASTKKLTYEIKDLQGKTVIKGLVNDNFQTIPVYQLSNSTYLLNVIENNNVIRTFRIIKN